MLLSIRKEWNSNSNDESPPLTRIFKAKGRVREGSMTNKLGIVSELWAFMRVRKKWWLGPIIFMLLLLGLLIILTHGSVLAPFIYTLF